MSRGYSPYNGASFTIGTEAANAITVNVQFTENGAEAATCSGRFYLSSDAAGEVHEAAAAGLSIAVGTDGMITPVAGSVAPAGDFLSESDGDLDIVITDTSGANTVYLNFVKPDGSGVFTSGAIIFAA
ncbi:MAG: hypothetical protein ACPG6R_10965 [Aequoribacter sp.]|uniref:hypothetical protein n=1 Tax=Aequoribacter sp. TaxID=2847771 RepID=UPI003C6353B9